MTPPRFAALGDSITAGFGDPVPGGWRGWAALLAECLAPEVAFHNLAVSGALTGDVVGTQLPAALRLRPDIASVVVGVNDTLRKTFDVEAVARALTETVGQLHATGAVVLTMRLPDPGRMLGLPASLARPLARRVRAVNAVADTVATRYATLHFDAARHPHTYLRAMWSVDRLHPSERGHRLLAAGFASLLAASGVPLRAHPSTDPTSPEPTRGEQIRWMATRGTRWMLDRSTDLVPYLLGMAATEWWQGLRGAAQRSDTRIDAEIAAALAVLEQHISAPMAVH
ncbi:MAG TPA: SGNH/GDSL hydrolase family protein [Planosporangium sp.]|nr:SGNH/GDSL hydrolase family protein [Planosporangium sp.]